MSADLSTRRVAVITGASSGIGEATGRALHAAGHRVALLARRGDRIHALADEFRSGAVAIEADVTDRDSLIAAAERVRQELGPVDILVNNAGVMLLAPFGLERSEEHRRMVETNLIGPMTATEVFLEQLRHGWSESLRLELQPNIRVIVIEPGAVATELARGPESTRSRHRWRVLLRAGPPAVD
jgi:NADP-dependent 3-hydroxy acid dehydrogenase YdfG